MKNIITSKFTAADTDAVNDLITQLETSIAGKTGVLTDDERVRYGSINEQNKLVVNKAHEYRQNQPNLSAPDVDWDEFNKDYDARMSIESWINRLTDVIHALQSTKIMHDYDNYQDALHDYGYSQFKRGVGEVGYDAKVDEYKQFFVKTKKNQPPDGGTEGENEG